MVYKVQFSPHAIREYKKLEPSVKTEIQKAVSILERQPFAGPDIKKLKGRLRAYYRYRIKDYRMVYFIEKSAHFIFVETIQMRKDAY